MTVTLTTSQLAEAMKAASEAHHSYELTLGHPDTDWPKWYAQWIMEHAHESQIEVYA